MNHHRSSLDDDGDREILMKSSPTWQAAALVDGAHTGDLPQPALLLQFFRLNRADLLASAVRDVLGSTTQAGAGAVLDGIRSNISACTGSPDTHSAKEGTPSYSSFYVPLIRVDVPLRSDSSAGRIGAGLAVFCQDSGLHPLDEREDVAGLEGSSEVEAHNYSIVNRGYTGMRRQRLGAASECACSLRPRGTSMAEIDAAMAQAAMGCAQCHLTRIHAAVDMASRCAAQQGDRQTAAVARLVQASRDVMESAISSIGKLQTMTDPVVANDANQSKIIPALASTHSFITARAAEVWIEGILRMARGLAEARHRLSTGGARNRSLRAAGQELDVCARAGLRVAVSLHGAIHAANESIVRSEGSRSDTVATRSVGAGLSAFLLHLLGMFRLREAVARVWDLERLVRPHPGLVEVDALVASLGGGPAADGIRQRLAACRPYEEVEIVREGALLSPDTEEAYSAVSSGPDEVWELAASRSRPRMLRYVALSSSAPINYTQYPTRELGIPHWVWHSPLLDSSDSLWCRGEADGDVLAHDLASIAAWQLRSSAGARKAGLQAVFRALDALGYRWPAIYASGVSLDAGSRVLAIRALRAITPIVQAYTSGSDGNDSRWVLDLQTWLGKDGAAGRNPATVAPNSSTKSVSRSISAARRSTSIARRQMYRIEELVATGAIGSAAHAWLSMVHDLAEGDVVGRAAAWPLLGGLAARVSLERLSRVLVDSEFAALYAAADAGMQEWNQALGTGSQMVTEQRTAGLTRRQRNRSSGVKTDALESCRSGGGLVSQQHPAILQVFRTAGYNVRGSEAGRGQNGRERLSSSHHLLVQADGMHEETGESGPDGQLSAFAIDPPKLATAVVGSASNGQNTSKGKTCVLIGSGDDDCLGTFTADPAQLLGSSWIGRVRQSSLSVVSGVSLAGHCRHHGERGAKQWLPQGLLRDLSGSSRGASMAGGLVGLDFALDAVRLLGWCVAVGIPSEEQERRAAAIAIGRVGLALHDVKMLRLALSLAPSADRECRLELAGYLAECLRATWVVGAHTVPRWARDAISIDWAKGDGDSAEEQAGARAAAAAASAACRYGDPHAALWGAIRANPAQEML